MSSRACADVLPARVMAVAGPGHPGLRAEVRFQRHVHGHGSEAGPDQSRPRVSSTDGSGLFGGFVSASQYSVQLGLAFSTLPFADGCQQACSKLLSHIHWSSFAHA